MIYILIGMSLLFVAIGFTVTENNAKDFLTGYNMMTSEERKNIDIRFYITYFRKFHIILATSFLIIGYGLSLLNKSIAELFLGFYPAIAYIFLVILSLKFFGRLRTKSNKIDLFALIGTLLFVIGLITYKLNENRMILDSQKIELHEAYGEIIITE